MEFETAPWLPVQKGPSLTFEHNCWILYLFVFPMSPLTQIQVNLF